MTLGFDDATNAVNEYFTDEWNIGPYSEYPVAIRGVENNYPDRQEPWVRLTMLEGAGIPSIGSAAKASRQIGTITAQIFARPGYGTGLPHAMADIAAGILDRTEIRKRKSGTINTRVPETIAQGVRVAGWYQVNVDVTYRRFLQASDLEVVYLGVGDGSYLSAGGPSVLLGVS